MNTLQFETFFTGEALEHLQLSIQHALAEDGVDLGANAVFSEEQQLTAIILAKEDTLVAGLPIIPLVLGQALLCAPDFLHFSTCPAIADNLSWKWEGLVAEGSFVPAQTQVATITGSARRVLKAERVMLNFITHLSGIANLVQRYVQALEGTGVQVLDTRKTLPGLRYPEKYAVLVGGGTNHRKNLHEMIMLKDNHIDAAGSISAAVGRVRDRYGRTCPPIEVECRTQTEVDEAVACMVQRIMLDNMTIEQMNRALPTIPPNIETEISGGVTLETIRSRALLGAKRPKYISVGRLTHSAPAADFSLRIQASRAP